MVTQETITAACSTERGRRIGGRWLEVFDLVSRLAGQALATGDTEQYVAFQAIAVVCVEQLLHVAQGEEVGRG